MHLSGPAQRSLVFPLALLTACPADDAATGGGTSGTDDTSSSTLGTTLDPTVGTTADDTGTTAVADSSGTDPTDATDSSGPGESSTTEAPNGAPEATDDVLHTLQDQPLDVAAAGLLDNDLDPDNDGLEVVDSDAVSIGGGAVAVGADGSVLYMPAPGFFGDDAFGYTISDGTAEASATVTVFVAPTLVPLGAVAGGMGGFVIDGESMGDEAGNPCRIVGDFDGDGLADLVLGAPTVDAPVSDAGRVYVVAGKNVDTDPVLLADVVAGDGGIVIDGLLLQGEAGRGLGGVGDFNGDGLADLGFGAPGDFVEAPGDHGFAYVVFGRDDGATAISVDDLRDGIGGMTFEGEFPNDRAGASVSAAGDVNGDGLGDLLIGAPALNTNSPSPADVGRTYVVFGREDTTPIVDLSDITAGVGGFAITGENDSDFSGFSAAAAGDVDGDGLADLIVGAPLADPGGVNSGRAYVVFGKDGDTDEVLLDDVAAGIGGFAIDGEVAGDAAGSSVTAAGDFDGDGLGDVMIGAPGSNANGGASGRAYLVFGKVDTTLVDLDDVVAGNGGFALTGEAAGDSCCQSVAAAGDVNDDGLGDVVLGSPAADFGGSATGRTYVVYGRSDGAASTLAEVAQGIGGFALDGEAMFDASGVVVSGGADVDGDGVDDVVLNAPGGDAVAQNAGRTYVVFGVPTGARR